MKFPYSPERLYQTKAFFQPPALLFHAGGGTVSSARIIAPECYADTQITHLLFTYIAERKSLQMYIYNCAATNIDCILRNLQIASKTWRRVTLASSDYVIIVLTQLRKRRHKGPGGGNKGGRGRKNTSEIHEDA